jgi:Uma2 family endonuclease
MSTVTHLTIAEYDQMIAAGAFDPRERNRVELVRGELLEMGPIGSEHEVIVDYLNEWSIRTLPRGRAWVRVQNSIGIPILDSAPEPDLAWVGRRDYRQGRPAAEDVLLVIEVSESTLRFDLGEKARLYAGAGIADYWVVDITERSVIVHREPADGRYRDVRTYRGSEEIHPLRVPEVGLCVGPLWHP